eukprot:EG_transcript_33828
MGGEGRVPQQNQSWANKTAALTEPKPWGSSRHCASHEGSGHRGCQLRQPGCNPLDVPQIGERKQQQGEEGGKVMAGGRATNPKGERQREGWYCSTLALRAVCWGWGNGHQSRR